MTTRTRRRLVLWAANGAHLYADEIETCVCSHSKIAHYPDGSCALARCRCESFARSGGEEPS